MSRKMGFWMAVVFAGALLLGVLGVVIFSLLETEGPSVSSTTSTTTLPPT